MQDFACEDLCADPNDKNATRVYVQNVTGLAGNCGTGCDAGGCEVIWAATEIKSKAVCEAINGTWLGDS